MTSYTDEAAVLPAETSLPDVIRLPELSGDLTDPDDVSAVLHRWRTRTGLRAQIGAGPDGVVTVDLRADGPHALVAGTTGSGKSELLQSLICSLALNNPPSRISFLLVDYKGGAAFSECADLPHTVGYITDLTPALVTRALTSLEVAYLQDPKAAEAVPPQQARADMALISAQRDPAVQKAWQELKHTSSDWRTDWCRSMKIRKGRVLQEAWCWSRPWRWRQPSVRAARLR